MRVFRDVLQYGPFFWHDFRHERPVSQSHDQSVDVKNIEQHWEADLFTNLVDLFTWMGKFLELLFIFALLWRLWGGWVWWVLWGLRRL